LARKERRGIPADLREPIAQAHRGAQARVVPNDFRARREQRRQVVLGGRGLEPRPWTDFHPQAGTGLL
jgi:hypothetical protein